MGSKGSQTTTSNQTQTYTPNPAIAGAGTQAINMAQSAAGQPFQMPAAPVAGFNTDQFNSFQGVRNAQGMAQPYINQGQSYLQGSAAPITADDVNQYYNPMASNITAQMQNIFGQQQQATTGQLTQAAGGVGADRIAVGQSNLANQQGLAAGQTYAGLYQQALQAAQQQKQMQAGAGYGISQLGTVAQGAALQGANALGATGNQQQQLSQAQLNSPYQQQLAQIAFPYQQAQYLAGITGGLGPALGGTTTGQSETTQPSASPWAQALGIGTGALGMFGASGGFDSSGKGSQTGATYGAPSGGWGSYGGTPYPTFGRGGAAGFADGGNTGNEPIFPGFSAMAPGNTIPDSRGLSPIPQIQLQPGSGQFHNNLKLDPPKSSGGGDDGIGSAIGTVAKVLPFLLKRGGAASADGGAVNPWDMNRGFAEGGDTTFDDRFSPVYDEPLSPYAPPPAVDPAASFDDRFGAVGGMRAGSDVMGDPQAAKDALVARGQSHITPFPQPRPMVPDEPQIDVADADGDQPGIPKAASPAGYPSGGFNSDMNVDQYMMPRGKQPYPDALDRDWGQKAARSPWMALIKAGATMAQTRGPIGSVIGAGLGAGAGALESERKERRGEQDTNQKAQMLYKQALDHLDKYQRKTPHEVAVETHQRNVLAQDKYAPTYGATEDGHPILYNKKGGPGIDAITGQPVPEDSKITSTRGGAGGSGGVYGFKYQMYLATHPGDHDGALNYASGRKQLSPEEINKTALAAAQREATTLMNNGQMPKGQTYAGLVAERANYYRGLLGPGGQQQEGGQGSTAATAVPDPGDGKRVKGNWYIGPSGKPQQWLGQ